MKFTLYILCIFKCILLVRSIMFHLEPNKQVCLREELNRDVAISGEYQVTEFPNQKVDYVVTDSKRAILAQVIDIRSAGKFSFVTDSQDIFEICFTSRVTPGHRGLPHEVTLDVKHGVEAKSYEVMGEAAKLKPMEIDLKRLEDLSESVVKDFEEMREREKIMRDTNESTNNRVFYLSLLSMLVLLGLASWQVFYFKRFFKAKKLIE